ncbi:hypothetical protein ACFFWE_15425 [Sphaerisporangium melleum]|nr:hypothetical protein [Sphaerisporangium melleum]
MDLTATPDVTRAADGTHPQHQDGETANSEPSDGVAVAPQPYEDDLSSLQRYAEELISHLAADGTIPPVPTGALDVPGHWLAPAVEALLLIFAGQDALDPLARAAQLDETNTALFLCLSLAVSGHGDRIHASWLGTAFGDLATDRPVSPGQRALWMAAARGAYGPAGKIFVLRKLDAAAVPSTAEPGRWLAALVPGDPTLAAMTATTSTAPAAIGGSSAATEPAAPGGASTATESGGTEGASAALDSVPTTAAEGAAETDPVVADGASVASAIVEPAGSSTPSSTGTASSAGAGPADAVVTPEAVAQALAASPALSALPALAQVPELLRPVQAAARLSRLLERSAEITATRPATLPKGEQPSPWAGTEPLAVLRSLIGSAEPGTSGSLTGHLLADVRADSDPHLAAIAFHVAAPVVRAAAEDLARATDVPPPDEIVVPIMGHDIVLRPEGADQDSLAVAEAGIRAEGAARLSGRWLAYAPALLPIVAVVLAFTVSELFAVAALLLGGVAGYILWRRSVREQTEARRVEAEVARLRDQAEAAMWALHDYAREAAERTQTATEHLTALTRLLRRGPAVAAAPAASPS